MSLNMDIPRSFQYVYYLCQFMVSSHKTQVGLRKPRKESYGLRF